MNDQRKLRTNLLQSQEVDETFGKCLMKIEGKKGMWILIVVVMIIFVISMWYCYYLDMMSLTFASVGTIIFMSVALICVSFMKDRILLYEYGLLYYTVFDIRKKRVAYDDITCLLARKLSRKQGKTTMWEVRIQDQKKGIRFDASSYREIDDCFRILARETKIEIIS